MPIQTSVIAITAIFLSALAASSEDNISGKSAIALSRDFIYVEGDNEWYSMAYLDRLAKEYIYKHDPSVEVSNAIANIWLPTAKTDHIARFIYILGTGRTNWVIYFGSDGKIAKGESTLESDMAPLNPAPSEGGPAYKKPIKRVSDKMRKK